MGADHGCGRLPNVKQAIFLMILSSAVISTNANAWFFVVLPGSVTGKIADVFTGSEGGHCVPGSVKVGDVLRLPDGGTATVKSLSGKSSRCPNESKPVRALLEISPLPTVSNIGIDLPDGWAAVTLTDQEKQQGWFFKARNSSTALYSTLFLNFRKHEAGNTDLMMVNITNAQLNMANRYTNSRRSAIEQISINGMRAWRYEVTGGLKEGAGNTTWTILVTTIEGKRELVNVLLVVPSDYFDNNRESLKQLAFNIKGLEPPASPMAASSTSETEH